MADYLVTADEIIMMVEKKTRAFSRILTSEIAIISDTLTFRASPRRPKDKIYLVENVDIGQYNKYATVLGDLDITLWDITTGGLGPRYYRHGTKGAAFESRISSSGYIDMGSMKETEILSDTKCFTIQPKIKEFPAGLTNLRVWRGNMAGLGTWLDDISVNCLVTSTWIPNRVIQSGVGFILSTTDPGNQNIFRNDGSAYIDGHNGYTSVPEDDNTSQYIYVSLNLKPGSFAKGFYGGVSTPLGLKFTYDYYLGRYYDVE